MPKGFEARYVARKVLRTEWRASSEWQIIFSDDSYSILRQRPRGIACKNEMAHEKHNREAGMMIWSAWRRIGDFSEDGGMAGAGGAGKIVSAPMECFVGEHGEGECFFGVGGNAESIGGKDF